LILLLFDGVNFNLYPYQVGGGSQERVAPMLDFMFGFNAFIEVISALISLAVGYYSFTAYRLFREKTLFSLYFSFMLQGAGLLTHGAVKITFFLIKEVKGARLPPPLKIPLISASYTICLLAQIAAYSILFYAYTRKSKWLAQTPLVIFLREYEPISQIFAFFLAALVTAHTAVNYQVRRELNSLLVFSGFLLISLGHFFFFLCPVSMMFFILASISQLAGYLSLLTMLLRVRKP